MSIIRPLLLLVVLALLAFGVWCWVTYPRIGHIVYKNAGEFEAKQYGYIKKTIEVAAGKNIVLLDGGRADAAAPVLFLVHGFTANKEGWLRFSKKFLSDYRVVIVDLPGHGETGAQGGWDYNPKAQAQVLTDLMAKMGIAKAHFVGNSMGGGIIAQMAHLHPAQVRSLVLMNAAGVVPTKPSRAQELYDQGINPFVITSRSDHNRFLDLAMHQPPPIPGFVRAAMTERHIELQPVYNQVMHALFKADDTSYGLGEIQAHLSTITAPTLILWGSEDQIISPTSTTAWSAIAQSKTVIMDGIGHLPMLEAPAESARICYEFIQAH